MRMLLTAGLVAALASPAAAAQKETERVDRTIPFQPGGSIVLKNFSGDVKITGADRPEVVLKAIRRGTRDRLDAIKLDIDVHGSSISIDANRRESWWRRMNNNVVETDFEIAVPRRTRLDVSAFSSDVTITGVEGPQKLHTFSGAIRVHGASGPFELDTFSGDIEVSVDAGIDAPQITAETFSGDIEARLPGHAGGAVQFNSFSGGLTSDLPLTLKSGSKRHLTGTLNADRGGNALRFKTFSGDVRIVR
jgi:DUF4097 and DUF4098 domain-containing protein YvlB